jgi:DNA-directed RNA polymerase specialized sigma24 family protein
LRVIALKLFDGLSFAEIAVRLDSSEEACKMRFSRGLAKLRTELERTVRASSAELLIAALRLIG